MQVFAPVTAENHAFLQPTALPTSFTKIKNEHLVFFFCVEEPPFRLITTIIVINRVFFLSSSFYRFSLCQLFCSTQYTRPFFFFALDEAASFLFSMEAEREREVAR